MSSAQGSGRRRSARRGAQILSTFLFVAAIAFAGAALYIWQTEDDDPDQTPPIPTSTPGRNGLADVLGALEGAGLEGDFGRSPATVKSNQMDPPGQNLRVEDQTVFIFIFTEGQDLSAVDAREAAMADLDAATMQLTTPSGRVVSEGETLSISSGSNVIAVLVGGDPDLVATVESTIENLP